MPPVFPGKEASHDQGICLPCGRHWLAPYRECYLSILPNQSEVKLISLENHPGERQLNQSERIFADLFQIGGCLPPDLRFSFCGGPATCHSGGCGSLFRIMCRRKALKLRLRGR